MVCMTEQDDGSGWKSSARGEQAWKEATERVASRNAQSRKIGKSQREAYERERSSGRTGGRVIDSPRTNEREDKHGLKGQGEDHHGEAQP